MTVAVPTWLIVAVLLLLPFAVGATVEARRVKGGLLDLGGFWTFFAFAITAAITWTGLAVWMALR